MAASATVTRVPLRSNAGKNFEKVIVDWVSAADGSCTQSIEGLYGWLIKLVTDPAAAGDAPTDNYDITLVDENGADALGGAGADRDTSNTETAYTFVTGAPTPSFLCGTHTFTIAAAGDSNAGRAVFYIVESL